MRAAFLKAISQISGEARLERLAAALQKRDLAAALDAIGFERALFREVEDALRAAYVSGGVTASEYLAQAKGLRGVRVRFNPYADRPSAWLAEHSAGLITRITQGQIEAVRATLALGMADGRSAKSVALDLVGRQGAGRRRIGGIIGLSAPQIETTAWAREALRSGDAEGLRRYLTLKTRDRRFDATIRRAIGGEKLTSAQAERIGDALASRRLAQRGEAIASTETLEAFGAGQMEATRQAAEAAGLPMSKIKRTWRCTRSRTSRDAHVAMHGQTVEGDAPFVSPSGARLRHPGDRSLGAGAKDVVRCKCWVQTKIELDF